MTVHWCAAARSESRGHFFQIENLISLFPSGDHKMMLSDEERKVKVLHTAKATYSGRINPMPYCNGCCSALTFVTFQLPQEGSDCAKVARHSLQSTLPITNSWCLIVTLRQFYPTVVQSLCRYTISERRDRRLDHYPLSC
jgi:hypothetical protein